MRLETFDRIAQLQAEKSTDYESSVPDPDDPCLLKDPTRRREPLCGWSAKLLKVLPFYDYRIKLPRNAEWYEAMYTSPTAKIELTGPAQKLSAFVLGNKPFDMGSPLEIRLVIGDGDQPDESLIANHPLLVVWAGPQGAFAAESPLLRDPTDPTAWQEPVAEIFDEVV